MCKTNPFQYRYLDALKKLNTIIAFQSKCKNILFKKYKVADHWQIQLNKLED